MNKISYASLGLCLAALCSGPAFGTVEIGFYEGRDTSSNINYGDSVALGFSDLSSDGITFTAPSATNGVETQAIGVLDSTLDSFDLYTAPSGSFTITMEATSDYNGGAYTTGTDLVRGARNGTSGLGVGDNRLRSPEAIIFTVDLDQDFLDSGFQLQLLSLNDFDTSSNGPDASIFDSTGSLVGSSNDAFFTSPLVLGDGDTFAYVANNPANRNQLGLLTLDIVAVPEPSTYGILIAAIAFGVVAARRKKQA
ncbi:MAG: PEP-CTERM sorting domain-containing protein [Opitutales bacterium]